MKTQQRKFVVEFKSGRRRSSVQPDSIWGNTDLKGLVRQAEADAPELFSAYSPSLALSEDSAEQGNREPRSAGRGEDAPVTLATPDQSRATATGAAIAARTSSVETELRREQPPAIKRRRRRSIVNRPERVESQVSSEESTDAMGDGLDSLEKENSYLKHLLAAHLIDQNAILRTMLERFDAR